MILSTSKESGGRLVITLNTDSLDAANVRAFRDEVGPVVAAAEGRVEIDCSGLVFVDSSGVAAFLHVNKLLREEQRPVRLTGVGPKVMTQLEMMHVHRSFDLQPGI